MSSFGVTLRLGLTVHGKQQLEVDGYEETLDGHAGLLASLGLNLLDGRGFGIDLNLTLRRYADSVQGYDYTYGTFALEPVFGGRFMLARALYVFVGAGPRLGMEWLRDSRDKGLVSGMRSPVQATYYLSPSLALSTEFSVGVDAVFWFHNEEEYSSGSSIGPIYDFSLGVRFL